MHCRRLVEISRRRAVVPLALFFGTFAWSFAYVSLPFYIQRLSGGDTATTLRWTGWILGVTPLVTVVMAPVWGRVAFLVASSALLLCLAPSTSVWAFSAVRFVQVLCVAPRFPIVVTGIAQQAGGGAIGTVNGARIAAGFVGPVLATTVLAWTSPAALYVVLALLGLLCVPCARGVGRGALA